MSHRIFNNTGRKEDGGQQRYTGAGQGKLF